MESALRDRFLAFKRSGQRIAALTAYDYAVARLLDTCGIDMVLVGDSLGMVVYGLPDTTTVTLSMMLHHTAAVARGVERAIVVADLPKGTYETVEDALAAAHALRSAGAHAVKLEGGRLRVPQIRALTEAGVPVIAHLGMLPQQVREEGGYRIKGRTPEQVDALKVDALAVQEAGVLAVVLELVTPVVASELSKLLEVPTIGIGSGMECDGQILVTHDLIGLFPWFRPKFVQPKVDVAAVIQSGVKDWIEDVRGMATKEEGIAT